VFEPPRSHRSSASADHEDPDAVAELVAAVERERGRLDVLVNDIFGGDRYMQWDKPLWEHDWQGDLRMLQMGVHTHLITGRAATVGVTWAPTAGNATTAQASRTSGSAHSALPVVMSKGKPCALSRRRFPSGHSSAAVASLLGYDTAGHCDDGPGAGQGRPT